MEIPPCAIPSNPNGCLLNAFGLWASGAWRRREAFWSSNHEPFDVIIVGGGIQGACLYHQLVREGRRVLLVDQGDFGGGTSQSSAMLVWGGLLYLKDLDFAAVARLSAARDRLIQDHTNQVEAQRLTFLFGKRPHRRPWAVHAGLWLYRMLALGRRNLPNQFQPSSDAAFIRDESVTKWLSVEEGHLRLSDAQFVFDFIESAQLNDLARIV